MSRPGRMKNRCQTRGAGASRGPLQGGHRLGHAWIRSHDAKPEGPSIERIKPSVFAGCPGLLEGGTRPDREGLRNLRGNAGL